MCCFIKLAVTWWKTHCLDGHRGHLQSTPMRCVVEEGKERICWLPEVFCWFPFVCTTGINPLTSRFHHLGTGVASEETFCHTTLHESRRKRLIQNLFRSHCVECDSQSCYSSYQARRSNGGHTRKFITYPRRCQSWGRFSCISSSHNQDLPRASDQ